MAGAAGWGGWQQNGAPGPVVKYFLLANPQGSLGGMDWLRFVDVGIYLALAVVVGQHWQNNRHHWIGLAISLAGFALWLLARHQLGSSFAVRAEAKELVTHGLYAKIRNPIYFFAFFAFLGEFVALGAYGAIPVLLMFQVGQYMRIKREQQVLEAAFGDEYRAYKSQTWF
jgi:protein-S-isoprenylcysteine O-methyltransferase Ste14